MGNKVSHKRGLEQASPLTAQSTTLRKPPGELSQESNSDGRAGVTRAQQGTGLAAGTAETQALCRQGSSQGIGAAANPTFQLLKVLLQGTGGDNKIGRGLTERA